MRQSIFFLLALVATGCCSFFGTCPSNDFSTSPAKLRDTALSVFNYPHTNLEVGGVWKANERPAVPEQEIESTTKIISGDTLERWLDTTARFALGKSLSRVLELPEPVKVADVQNNLRILTTSLTTIADTTAIGSIRPSEQYLWTLLKLIEFELAATDRFPAIRSALFASTPSAFVSKAVTPRSGKDTVVYVDNANFDVAGQAVTLKFEDTHVLALVEPTKTLDAHQLSKSYYLTLKLFDNLGDYTASRALWPHNTAQPELDWFLIRIDSRTSAKDKNGRIVEDKRFWSWSPKVNPNGRYDIGQLREGDRVLKDELIIEDFDASIDESRSYKRVLFSSGSMKYERSTYSLEVRP